MIRKKINLENLLLIFIVMLPILDMASFIFRNMFNTSFSPSTVLRPVVPITAILVIFFKNKFKLKTILIATLYGIYAITHIVIYYYIKSESSYGTIVNEIQYLMNYTFMILNLFIYSFIFKNENSNKLKKHVLISSIIYIVSIYLSIITDTSSTTYIEGIGIKGWFESGNSISSIFILSIFILLIMLKDKSLEWRISRRKMNLIVVTTIALIGIFLTTLVGTRVGLFGFVLVLGLYILTEIFFTIKDKGYLNKKVVIASICIIVIAIILVEVKGSNTLKRREFVASLENNIIDEATGKASHISGDILKFKEDIEAGRLSEQFMPIAKQKAIASLYEFANKYEIQNTDRRIQQLVYNVYLVKHQANAQLMLFGNGYLSNYGELTLEMEIPAFLFNFGIIGFGLYFMPFLSIFIYAAFVGIKNIKKIDVEYVMLLGGVAVSFVLSFLSGYTFFNQSTVMIIIILTTLLINKGREIIKYRGD